MFRFSPAASLFQWAARLSAEAFHTDGYVLVDEAERGRVDTKAGAEHTTLDLTLERLISDRGPDLRARLALRRITRERHAASNQQHLHSPGSAWEAIFIPRAPARLRLRAFALTEIYNQDFSSIAADRNSEALTRSQRVPAQQVGFITQWSRAAGFASDTRRRR